MCEVYVFSIEIPKWKSHFNLSFNNEFEYLRDDYSFDYSFIEMFIFNRFLDKYV